MSKEKQKQNFQNIKSTFIFGKTSKSLEYLTNILKRIDLFLSKFKIWLFIKEVNVPIQIFFITRISIIFAVWFGIDLLRTSYNIKVAPNGFPDNLFLSPWTGWDAGHYARIVQEGYVDGTQPFFPFYPFLAKLVNIIFHNALLSQVIVSNLAFLFGLIIFYKLVVLKFNEEIAERSAFYLSIFPTTFFFICGLTEATFFLVSVATFYFAEKRKWLLSGIFGILTSLTRSTGFLISIPIFLIYILKKKIYQEPIKRDIIPVLLIPSGLLIFMGILVLFGHHPLDFIYYGQKGWPRIFAFPLWDLWRSYEVLASVDIAALIAGYYPVRLLASVVLVTLFLVLSVFCLFKMDFPYGIYSILLILFALSNPATEWLLYGDLRYILVVFPIFILFAMYGKSKFVNYLIILLSITILTIFAIYNGMGGWIS